jgi:hypothetical protein
MTSYVAPKTRPDPFPSSRTCLAGKAGLFRDPLNSRRAFHQKPDLTVGFEFQNQEIKIAYANSTFAPAASNFFLASSAFALLTCVNTSLGADSTNVFAS